MTPTVTIRFPLDQIVHLDAMATVDTTVWRCRIRRSEGTTRTTPRATNDAIAHLRCDHGDVAEHPAPGQDTPPMRPGRPPVEPVPRTAIPVTGRFHNHRSCADSNPIILPAEQLAHFLDDQHTAGQ